MKIGNRVTNPGELNTQIILAKRIVTTDAGGFQVTTYEHIAQVWARWANVHGSEAWTSASLGFTAPATVLMRYLVGVDATCVVYKGAQLEEVIVEGEVTGLQITGGLMYEIVSLDNIDERSEYLELKVQRKEAG